MDFKKDDLQNEQGSVQQQTQGNQHHIDAEKRNEDVEFGVIPVSEARGSDVSLESDEVNLEDIDDEKVIPAVKAKRSPWNSITFDRDDFFSGLAHA